MERSSLKNRYQNLTPSTVIAIDHFSDDLAASHDVHSVALHSCENIKYVRMQWTKIRQLALNKYGK